MKDKLLNQQAEPCAVKIATSLARTTDLLFPNQGLAKQPHAPINYHLVCFPAVGLKLEV